MHERFSVAAWTLLMVMAAPLVAADWPHWRGPGRDGISAESGWKKEWSEGEPPVLWRAEVGTGFSSFSAVDGKVLTMGNADDHDTVFCFDALTGKVIWTHRYPAPIDAKFYEGGPTSTPAVAGDAVFTMGKRGQLFCLALEDGAVRWSADAGEATGAAWPSWGYSGSPVVIDDLVVVNVGKSGAAFSREDGSLVWKSDPAEAGYTTPLPYAGPDGGDDLVLVSSGEAFTAVERKTGEPVWSHRWVTRYGVNAADPVVAGEHIFIASGYGKGGALLEVGGDGTVEEVWKDKVIRSQMNPGVLWEGFLYGTDGDQGDKAPLKCVELLTGDERWEEKNIGTGGLILADGHLVVLSEKGELIVAPASPDGFEPTLRFQVLGGKSWTAPVLSDGLVFCRNSAGEVACVDLRSEGERPAR